MATYTGNLNLKKPDQSDKIRIADFNGNSDAIDAAIGGGFGVGSSPSIDDAVNSMGEGLAIISNGNTHAAITSGKYVYVRGHGTLAEGLYVATASIAQNGTLSLNNVSAVSGGGLNALNTKINDYHSNSGTSTYTSWDVRYSIIGRVCTFIFGFTPSSNISSSIGSIGDTGLPNPATPDYVCIYPVTKVQQSYTLAETQNRFGGIKNIGSANSEVRAVGAYEAGVKYSFCGSYVAAS